ncbi:MAG TPA: hypothetical protein VGN75_17680 [Kaistia sp.]|jgi:hypothetical protein|nr:hypothetical protein [Kaistia sp.]
MSRIEDGGAVEAGYGWVYLNEDTGIEWAEQHPVHSGEVPDATDVRVATAAVLQSLLTEAWSDNAAKDAEITRLRAEVERLSKPDMFWLWQDPEYACEGWKEALEETGSMAEVIRFQTAHELPDRWGAHLALTVDEHGDPDETKPALFDTEAEASACWPDSLRRARAALSKASQAEGQTP